MRLEGTCRNEDPSTCPFLNIRQLLKNVVIFWVKEFELLLKNKYH